MNHVNKLEKYKYDHIPVELTLTIGFSNITVLTLNNVNVGDTLFVNQQTHDVVIQNKVIGHFTNDNGVYMINTNFYNDNIDNTINDDDNLIESSDKLSSKGDIPITL
ncbi:hypothetical protein [Arsenophonus endosymbiont of Aleurodicus floccissimus]|uniref:hypothetical protein n=1 Tax=Arsenophonus endosymbiont of Aleurodicus floccissimus TaxID=2152761 RepID=UPI001601C089|nr:hypothetical protein [Arsenophonus endosymbiont of Aleurodicus floccissimus]